MYFFVYLVLVFRGTLPWDIKNWIEDINFLATNFSLCDNKCKVHRGFYDAYKQIGTKVLSTTKSYMEKYNMSNIM